MRFITALRSGSDSWVLLLSFALAACGGGAAAVVAPTLSSGPAPRSAPAVADGPVAKSEELGAPVVPPADATVLTDTQRAKDAALAPKAALFAGALSNVDAQLSKDHKKVLFRSNRDGVWQAYLGDAAKPAQAPVRLAESRDGVLLARFSADERSIIFTRDEHGDDRYRIYRVGLDGQGVTSLTPDDGVERDAPQLPRLRPTQMVYSARDRGAIGTRVYVQPLAGGEARVAYSDPFSGVVVDVSPDGNHALLVRAKSKSEAVLFRIDLDEGTASRVFPQSDRKAARITAARYSADGKRVFVATDDGSESSFVLRIEPGSGVVSGRYREESPSTASIAAIAVSPKEDRVAIEVDAGNHTETRLLDESLRLVATVRAPLGEVSSGEFASDGKTLTVTASAPDKPADVFEVDATTGAMRALRSDARAPLPGLTVAGLPRMDLADEKIPSEGLIVPANVYFPSGKRDHLATLVVVHDGPAASAHLRWNPTTSFLVAQGYAVVEPNVRGSTGFGRAYELADDKEKRALAFKDLEAVHRWVEAQTWCDRDRLVVMGEGYGGYMALIALSRQPKLWRAGIDLSGMSDLRTFLRAAPPAVREQAASELGDPVEEPALLGALSPLAEVEAIVAPVFVYHGENDRRVPRAESDALVAALRERHVPVEYMVGAEEGHAVARRETQIARMTRLARFLDENVPKTTAPLNVAKNGGD